MSKMLGTTIQNRLSGKRHRVLGVVAGYCLLAEITSDDYYRGNRLTLPLWWTRLWYKEVEHVPMARLVRER